MPRVVLYARYSSDNQRDASIEDQLRQCRERATREGWTVVDSYSDRAISGASLVRAGIQKLLADAQAGRFDRVLSEALNRISRDQEDVAAMFILLAQNDEWAVQRCRYMTLESVSALGDDPLVSLPILAA
ncbi:recombinase family protein [Xanthobacter dioxanivorans]|uniref:Recombinase family protein n=1 Tax=Xanthobacter dioxanivorans TaxID=2528964 RepID=A0A974PNX7_9HYPH|nr:recombinase family protein [Xanthobacter dioxanivorans]